MCKKISLDEFESFAKDNDLFYCTHDNLIKLRLEINKYFKDNETIYKIDIFEILNRYTIEAAINQRDAARARRAQARREKQKND